jgi:hypothetical protein
MNKNRRLDLDSIIVDIYRIKERLCEIGSDEQEYYDNMPESIQSSDKGDAVQAACDAIDGAIDSIDEVIEYIMEAMA